jgi:hypothetical protein
MDGDEWKDVNDVIYAVAKRARELANESMDELRLTLTSSAEGSLHAARQEFTGYTKGELIEAILTEEMCEEFPRNIGEYE